MLNRVLAAIICAPLAFLAAGCAAQSVSVPQDEARLWICHTVPLPKEIIIREKVSVPVDGVAVRVPAGAGDVVLTAVESLKQTLGTAGKPDPANPAFTINLQLGGPSAEPLKSLKNAGQACRITPASSKDALIITALQPIGLRYGLVTLNQLLRPRVRGSLVEIPLVEMTDWPDMADRGLWGTDSFRQIPWMAERKMNIVEQISNIGVRPDGSTFGKYKEGQDALVEVAPKLGVNYVPVVLHLEQVIGKGVSDAYPQLVAKNGGSPRSMCYSEPAVADVIGGWIADLASQPGVREVDVWMTENMAGEKGCLCPGCAGQDRNVLEIRAILAGWEKAKKRVPGVGLRILTSEETEDSNRKIFDELPLDVFIWYYHSLLTYTANSRPMLRPYLAEYAKKGHPIGVCPNLVYSIHFAQPCTGPQFVHARMSEFLQKGMSGLLGYATPRVNYGRFNVEAAAEWGWNLNGRSPREFAYSWAVRQGLRDPEKFADWCEVEGPVSWAVSGSHWASGENRNVPGKVAKRLKEGTLPELGFVLWDAFASPWGDIKGEAHLQKLLADSAKAVQMSREMGIPEFYYESLVYRGHMEAIQALWELRKLVRNGSIREQDREAATRWFRAYIRGLQQVVDVLPRWERLVPGRPEEEKDWMFTDRPVETARRMIEEMREVAREMGIRL
ncbi:MAG: hypothetical protein ACUVSM_10875 [Armatimonadota bacterium]